MPPRAPPSLHASWPDVRRFAAQRLVPAGLVAGASMETFMYYTGFWKVATRKAAERNADKAAEAAALKRTQRAAAA